jgi:hypothetical protein
MTKKPKRCGECGAFMRGLAHVYHVNLRAGKRSIIHFDCDPLRKAGMKVVRLAIARETNPQSGEALYALLDGIDDLAEALYDTGGSLPPDMEDTP